MGLTIPASIGYPTDGNQIVEMPISPFFAQIRLHDEIMRVNVWKTGAREMGPVLSRYP